MSPTPVRYADPSACPNCRGSLDNSPGRCATCGMTLTGPLASDLFGHLMSADRILEQMRVPLVTPALAPEPGYVAPVEAERPIPVPPHPPHPPRRGLSQATVPQILLGLGALCLLVAAVVFLALAWSVLGVGGRTAVLVTLTAVAFAVTLWLEGRGLRWAAEALATVAVGLLSLDLVGAQDAGWFGALGDDPFMVVGGLLVAAACVGLVLRTGIDAKPLVAPQLIGVLALSFSGVGLVATLDSNPLAITLTCLALAGATTTWRLPGWRPFAAAGALTVVPWWSALVLHGLARVADTWDYAGVAHAWPALAAAALLGAVAWLGRGQRGLVVLVGGAAIALALLVVVRPLLTTGDPEDWRPAALGASLVVLACAAVLWSRRDPWSDLAALPGVVLGGYVTLLAAPDILVALGESASDEPWTRGWRLAGRGSSDLLLENWHELLAVTAVAALALGLARAYDAGRSLVTALLPLAGGVLAVTAAGVLLEHGALQAIAVALLVVAGAACAVLSPARVTSELAATALWGLAVLLALPSHVLTLLACLAVVATAAALALLRDDLRSRWAESVTPPAVAGLVVSVSAALSLGVDWRGVAAVAVLGATVAWRPTDLWLASATTSGAIAGLLGVAAAEDATLVLAITLTVAGAAFVVTALLHPGRRWLSVPGGLLLAGATWVRLWDLEVDVVEAYTLPSAVVLVALGLWHLRTRPEASTRFALTPGLVLSTVPSLLVALVDDDLTVRALLLALACLALVLAGVTLRWSAPLLVGGVVGAVLALRVLGPFAADVPPWILLGTAGVLLTVVGVTWEQRVRDLRRAGAYLARLR